MSVQYMGEYHEYTDGGVFNTQGGHECNGGLLMMSVIWKLSLKFQFGRPFRQGNSWGLLLFQFTKDCDENYIFMDHFWLLWGHYNSIQYCAISINIYQLFHQYHKILAACNIRKTQLVSYLILHNANILWYWCNNCFIVCQKVFCRVKH